MPRARYGAFLPSWQQVAAVGARPVRVGVEGCFEVIDQLAGTALPASTWLRAVLPARVADVHDGMLDQLIASGDVVWWGVSPLAGGDGVVALAPADRAPLLRPAPPGEDEPDGPGQDVLDVLALGGALFFRDIADRVGVGRDDAAIATDAQLVEVLWSLVWAGRITNDGWAALRARIAGTRTPVRRGRSRLPQRSGPPAAAGRWSLLPVPAAAPAEAAAAQGQALLERHGIVTRGSVVSERVPGGFAAVYRVLSAFEDAGRCRRTYAVEGLGAAQFALPGAVDRLRALAATGPRSTTPAMVVLAATDPAQAYGAALPWPDHAAADRSHRPGRKAGAVVVLADGEPVLYLERGGKSLLTWEHPRDRLLAAARALASQAPHVGVDRFTIGRVDGVVADQDTADLLVEAGFLPTPRGFRSPRA